MIKPKDTCKQEREIDALANIVREEPKDLLTNLKLVEGPNASQPCENNRDKQGPQQIDATGNKVLGVFGKKKIRVVRGEEKLNCRIH